MDRHSSQRTTPRVFLGTSSILCAPETSAAHCDAQDTAGAVLTRCPAGYYVWLTTAGLFCGRGATPLHSQGHTRSHQCSGAGAMAVYTFLAPSCWSRQRDIGTTVQTLTITPQLDDMDARALVVEDLGLSASRISTSRFGVAKLQKHRCWPRDVCTEVHSPYTQKMPKKKIKNNRTRQHSTLQPQVFVNALRRSVRSRIG